MRRSVMSLNMIHISHLTKAYSQKKGVFDITLEVKAGEVYGYLGPNGAGKSTTMRHLMGFSKPQSGTAEILGMNCWSEQPNIQKHVGYLPGEIAFPDDMTGLAYLKLIAGMRHMPDFTYAKELLERFEIDPNTGIKRMSKGMKQKIGITAAFMHDPDILLLDEPTSSLDPLMQNRFIELIEQKKKQGKTILLSSHIFEEVEKTCDRVGMIRSGKLVKEVTIDELRHSQRKTYKIEFADASDARKVQQTFPDAIYRAEQNQLIVTIHDASINSLITLLSTCDLHFLKEEKHTLEEYFMQYYGGDEDD